MAKLAALVVVGFVANLALGWLSLRSSVKSVDQSVYDAAVDGLQAIPGWTSASEILTDLGSLKWNRLAAVVLAVALGAWRRSVVVGLLVLATFAGTNFFQWLTVDIIDGTKPIDDRIIGNAGPYFSGGVQRVVVLAGMAFTVLQPSLRWKDRTVWAWALGLGILEGITRLTLGRHWPIDVVLALPIGLGLVWVFRKALQLLTPADNFATETASSR